MNISLFSLCLVLFFYLKVPIYLDLQKRREDLGSDSDEDLEEGRSSKDRPDGRTRKSEPQQKAYYLSKRGKLTWRVVAAMGLWYCRRRRYVVIVLHIIITITIAFIITIIFVAVIITVVVVIIVVSHCSQGLRKARAVSYAALFLQCFINLT